MLLSVFALAALTALMMLWMYATRLPAMQRAGLEPQAAAHTASLTGKLPASAERVADNYNHLTEAPTVFYAVALAIVALGAADQLHAVCAWAYVGLRFAHSLVQATVNRVAVRFVLFTLSWAALTVIILRGSAKALSL
nr:MAPEG family protein [Polymorphobacter multimanifer]